MRRRLTLALVPLGVLPAAAGFTFLDGDRFDGRSTPLAGTPVTLQVERGVGSAELAPVRVGLRAGASYIGRLPGRPLGIPVVARVVSRSGCGEGEGPDHHPLGVAAAGRMCLAAGSTRWRWLASTEPAAAAAIAAHELAHVAQSQLGCLGDGADEPRWLIEGMAVEIGWRALVRAGLVSRRAVARAIAQGGAFDVNLRPLRHYETQAGRDAEYALWQLATRALSGGSIRPLVRWCRLVGTRVPSQRAFQNAFGTGLERFYEDFEWARLKGRLAQRVELPAR